MSTVANIEPRIKDIQVTEDRLVEVERFISTGDIDGEDTLRVLFARYSEHDGG